MTDTTDTTTNDGASTPQAPAGTEPGTNSGAQSAPDPAASLPDWAKDPTAAFKMVSDLRAENARDRTAAKQTAAQEAQAAILQALGLAKKDEPVDPAKVAAELAQKDQTIRDLQVKSALADALAAAHAKPIARAAILGDGVLADLDPTSATFAADLAARVTDYVGKNPDLKASGQAPRSSGTDSPGGEAPKRTYTRAQLRDFEFYQANKKDIDLAASEGRITD